MKIRPIAALLLTSVLCFSPDIAFSFQADVAKAKTENNVQPDIKAAQKACRARLAQLNALHEQDQAEELFNLMTPKCQDTFCADLILMAVEFASVEESDPEFKKLREIVKEHNLKSIKLPRAITSMEPDAFPTEQDFEKARQAILGAVKKADRKKIATKVRLALQESEFTLNPFEGKFVGATTQDDVMTLEIEPPQPSSEEMKSLDGEGGPGEFFVLNMFHDFKKTDSGWKWHGINDEKMKEAMESMGGEMGFNMAPFATIEDLVIQGKTADGKSVDLKDYRGKVLLVDFWGTWCGPCVEELPTIKKIYKALNKHGFEVVGVALDDAETLKKFYKKKHELPWKNVVDAKGKLSDKYKIQAFPTTLLVDKNGKHIKSDLHGVALLDKVISELKLDPNDFAQVRKELRGKTGHAPEEAQDVSKKPIGFSAADADGDGGVAAREMKTYLDERLEDDELPHPKVFKRLDADKNGVLSESEFEKRHEAIVFFMGDNYFGGGDFPEPSDPGKEFVPVRGLDQPVNDKAIFGAVYHRYYELLDQESDQWNHADLDSVPASIKPQKLTNEAGTESDVQRLIDSSVIIAGGGRDFFTAGAVLISQDGLAITNYHVAEAMENSKLVGMTADGKTYRITELIAGNLDRDVALVRLNGSGFKPIKLATKKPKVGDDIVMMHHSENRFFTYDRGYVMRHPIIGDHPWMEISADYAPGGSGCGIFNRNLELVGLVSIIQFGDGPSLAEGLDLTLSNEEQAEIDGEAGMTEMGMLLVKHAVPLDAIQTLWSEDAVPVAKPTTTNGSRSINEAAAKPSKYFEAPAIVTTNKKAINADMEIYYPSPAIFDIDNDKKNELVVGSLMGTISVYENQSGDSKDPVWKKGDSPRQNGQPMVLDNW